MSFFWLRFDSLSTRRGRADHIEQRYLWLTSLWSRARSPWLRMMEACDGSGRRYLRCRERGQGDVEHWRESSKALLYTIEISSHQNELSRFRFRSFPPTTTARARWRLKLITAYVKITVHRTCEFKLCLWPCRGWGYPVVNFPEDRGPCKSI